VAVCGAMLTYPPSAREHGDELGDSGESFRFRYGGGGSVFSVGLGCMSQLPATSTPGSSPISLSISRIRSDVGVIVDGTDG